MYTQINAFYAVNLLLIPNPKAFIRLEAALNVVPLERIRATADVFSLCNSGNRSDQLTNQFAGAIMPQRRRRQFNPMAVERDERVVSALVKAAAELLVLLPVCFIQQELLRLGGYDCARLHALILSHGQAGANDAGNDDFFIRGDDANGDAAVGRGNDRIRGCVFCRVEFQAEEIEA